MRPNHHSLACYPDANGKVELQVRGRPREDPVSSTLEIGYWRLILGEMESTVLTVPLDLNLVPPASSHFHCVQDLEVLNDKKSVHNWTTCPKSQKLDCSYRWQQASRPPHRHLQHPFVVDPIRTRVAALGLLF
jgi:hypothetical protein